MVESRHRPAIRLFAVLVSAAAVLFVCAGNARAAEQARALTLGSEYSSRLDPGGDCINRVPAEEWQLNAEPLIPLTVQIQYSEPLPIVEALDSRGRPAFHDLQSDPERSSTILQVAAPLDGQLTIRIAADMPCKAMDYRLRAIPTPSAVPPDTGEPRVLALLAGVSKGNRRGRDLPGVAADLAAVEKLLTRKFDLPQSNLKVLRDPTRLDFMEAFGTFLSSARPQDAVIVYFSGHGTRVANALKTGALDPEPEDGKDEVLLFSGDSVLVDDEFGVLLSRLAAERVLVIVDSCYSGDATRGPGFDSGEWISKSVPSQPNDMSLLDGLGGAPTLAQQDLGPRLDGDASERQVVLTASDEHTVAFARLNAKYPSVFTSALVEQIPKSASRSQTFADLLSAVRPLTRDATLKAKVSPIQVPQASGPVTDRIEPYFRSTPARE